MKAVKKKQNREKTYGKQTVKWLMQIQPYK